MSLTGRVNTHIYQISTGLREPPPAQGVTSPTGGSVTPLGNLLSLILPFLLPLALTAYIFAPRDFTPTAPSAGMVMPVMPVQSVSPLAFANAVGYGAAAWGTMCDDSVRVIKVSNTNDTGDGSLRAAIDSGGVGGNARKIVVFTTTGVITFGSTIDPSARINCMYFAGQTAPIEIRAGHITFEKTDSAIIWRYINSNVQFLHYGGSGYYYDHIDSKFSLSRTFYMVADTSAGATNAEGPIHEVTISNSLLAATQNIRHLQIGGGPDPQPPMTRVSLYRNWLGHGVERQPMMNADTLELVNNIAWNFEGRGPYEFNHEFIVDAIANRAKGGQATDADRRPWFSRSIFNCDSTAGADKACSSKLYAYGNIYGNNLTDITLTAEDMGSDDGNLGIVCHGTTITHGLCVGQSANDTVEHGDSTWSATRVAGPSPDSVPINFDIRSGTALEDSILDFVGNTALIDSLGFMVYAVSGDSVRDSVASRMLQEYIDSSTVYTADSLPLTHGPPGADLVAWSIPTDTDGGGVPDAYEDQCGMDKDDASDDITDDDGNGYSNIEEWVNGNNELGQRPSWTDNSDNEEWFVLFRDRGAGKVTVDSVAPNITAYDDVDGRPGDIYYVVAKNVNFTSDTLLVGTARCSGQN